LERKVTEEEAAAAAAVSRAAELERKVTEEEAAVADAVSRAAELERKVTEAEAAAAAAVTDLTSAKVVATEVRSPLSPARRRRQRLAATGMRRCRLHRLLHGVNARPVSSPPSESASLVSSIVRWRWRSSRLPLLALSLAGASSPMAPSALIAHSPPAAPPWPPRRLLHLSRSHSASELPLPLTRTHSRAGAPAGGRGGGAAAHRAGTYRCTVI
jgi:hypothetical protein